MPYSPRSSVLGQVCRHKTEPKDELYILCVSILALLLMTFTFIFFFPRNLCDFIVNVMILIIHIICIKFFL